MTRVVRRTGSSPVAPPSNGPGTPSKKLPVPCWLLFRRHRFDGDQEYTPGRKLTMMRRCSACGQKVNGGEIHPKKEE